MKLKAFFSNFYNIFISFLGVLVTLPFLAPIFLHLGWERLAKVIYFIYSFFCHQFATRSIDVFDYQVAWCARDTAIWIAIFIMALLVKFKKLPSLRWYWVLPFIIPMALDGGLQTIFTFLNLTPTGILSGEPLYISNNLSRFMTGAIFGIGVGWWLSQQIEIQIATIKVEEGLDKYNEAELSKLRFVSKYSHVLWSLFLVVIMFIVYVGLVQLWDLTSLNNKPLNGLDSAVKSSGDLFFVRRADAVCPSQGTDLFKFDCFFN